MISVDPYQLLTPAQCREVIEIGRHSTDLRPGHMKGGDGLDYVAPNVRRSTIAFLKPAELGPYHEILLNEVVRLNTAVIGADIEPEKTQFQFAMYDGAQGEFITWHADEPLWDANFRGKKVSMVTQLSDPADYEGGVLEMRGKPPVPRGAGVTVAFPSFLEHRVTPVTKGWRYSIVTWARGPHWR